MKVIDLYSGCGGMSLGFMQAGYDVIAAFDNWQSAIDVHKRNHHILKHPIINLDLSDPLEPLECLRKFDSDMIIGGPPCQDFSSAGKRDESLGRADLTVVFSKIVCSLSPKWFVMENVDRTLKSNAYSYARQVFQEGGYGLSEIILDASRCGVPQKRKRLFLIGEHDGPDSALLYYLNKNLSKTSMTLRDYFGDKLGIEYYYRHPRSYQRRAIFSIDEPSPTIRGVNRPVPKTYVRHKGDKSDVTPDLRPLTFKERSLIQTFPDKYLLDNGSKTDIEQLIGNAVPVKLAKYVADCILEYIEDDSNVTERRAKQLRLI